jgi:xylulokinase
MARLLGIDIGTSGCKAVLIDETGRMLASASAEYPISTPQTLWSEQDPEDWFIGVQKCLEAIDAKPDAIGLTGQMHGAVFLDSEDKVIRPAILWNDQRTVAECAEIDHAVGQSRVRELTGNPPLTGFQLPKILWLRNHEPEAFTRLRSVLLPKDYIRLRLTGVKAGDVSDASGTGAFDLNRRCWSREILSAVGLPESLFPSVYESDEITAKTAAGIPVVAGGGDQAAGAVGTGAVNPNVLSISLGTSGVVFNALDEPRVDPNGAVHTFCHANRGWHAMGVMLSCGGAVRWLRDTLYPETNYDAITAQAEQSVPGCRGLTFLPYLTGERTPHNDPLARAAWAGLTLAHTRADLARAVFEGVTFGLRDGFDRLRALGAPASEARVTGGGAKSRFWLQLLADVFEMPCVTLESDEGPAFGAALLAGVGIGLYADVAKACSVTIRRKDEISPSSRDYSTQIANYRALYPSLREWSSSWRE